MERKKETTGGITCIELSAAADFDDATFVLFWKEKSNKDVMILLRSVQVEWRIVYGHISYVLVLIVNQSGFFQ